MILLTRVQIFLDSALIAAALVFSLSLADPPQRAVLFLVRAASLSGAPRCGRSREGHWLGHRRHCLRGGSILVHTTPATNSRLDARLWTLYAQA